MNKNEETATLAGGCFWCTEAVFQRLKGVLSVTSGYSGDGKINPTTVDRQGNDVGPQYKSAIFYRNRKQKDAAEKSKKELGKEGVYKNPAVTKILPFAKFYPAEKYHVRFYENNPSSMYCNLVITPKVDKLYGNFGDKIKKE